MTNIEAEWVEGGMRDRHLVRGAVAAAVSCVFHILIYWILPGFEWQALETPSRPPPEPRDPTHLREVYPKDVPDVTQEDWFPARHASEAAVSRPVAAALPVPESVLEPRVVPKEDLDTAAEPSPVADPKAKPQRGDFEPRLEIVEIAHAIVPDNVAAMPRRYIPAVTRSAAAPDVSLPTSRPSVGEVANVPRPAIPQAKIASVAAHTEVRIDSPTEVPQEPATVVANVVKDLEGEALSFKAIEGLLLADVRTYVSPKDARYGYFRIDIHRKGEEVLPVLPKDFLFVQDCSASITEQRLYFCRQGLIEALKRLGPQDRFNVISFRDRTESCFADWTPVSAAALQTATRFVEQLTSFGDTDIYASLRELLSRQTTPGRPVIVQLITDGVPTVGVTDSARIIEDFSNLNLGARSVFSMGTVLEANRYLLDLLSYRNRGDSFVVTKGRWDIPDSIVRRTEEVARPVLSDLRFRFADARNCEVYPALTSNLYLDRPLVLYGRYPLTMASTLFQVVGRAADTSCDMVFDLDLAHAASGPEALRESWAWQKVYHLMGEFTRTRSRKVLDEIDAVARAYKIKVPYRERL